MSAGRAFTLRTPLVLGAASVAVAGLCLATASPTLAAESPCNGAANTATSCTYSYTGDEQFFTVPTGVTNLDVVATGADGGGSPAGRGATVEATTVPVRSGETLIVYVGDQGGSSSSFGGSGGWPGGGDGGAPAGDRDTGGSGGGGYSGVFRGSTPLVIAAGGGGGSRDGLGGDGDTGTGGSDGSSFVASGGGGGAQGTTGGRGGIGSFSGSDGISGSSLQGGSGGFDYSDEFGGNAGGGGGGGLAGGGGGGAGQASGGGGGGSSYAVYGFTSQNIFSDIASVTITFQQPLTRAVVTSVSPRSGATSGGYAVTITGSHFTGATRVVFGQTRVTDFIEMTDNKIVVFSPPHVPGWVHVRVHTVGLSAKVPEDRYRYVAD